MIIHVAFFAQTTPVAWKIASICLAFVRRGGRKRRGEEEGGEEGSKGAEEKHQLSTVPAIISTMNRKTGFENVTGRGTGRAEEKKRG
jgi:hypothetical protein